MDDEPSGAAARALDAAGTVSIPIAVRVSDPTFPADSGLDARLAVFQRRHVPVWL